VPDCVLGPTLSNLTAMTENLAATSAQPTRAKTTRPEEGVNLVGFFHAEFGQGEVVRRLAEAFRHAGLSFSAVPLREIPHRYIPHRQDHPFRVDASEPMFDVNVLCLNAEHVVSYAETTGRELLADRYTVGVWFWETETFPEGLLPALDYVDEVWVASEFVATAIGPETWKPVLTFPLPVPEPKPEPVSRSDFVLPEEAFLFAFAFDFFSTVERKNPAALVEAFTREFAPGSGAHLLIKTINGDKRADELQSLIASAGGHPDVSVHDGYLPPETVTALTAAADCYVSLHRSEGFGLTIAEALALGKPTIATGYSGNLTFMDTDGSYLVPYRLTPVPDGAGPYPAGALWADPDVDAASALMREVFDAPDEALRRAARGRETVLRRQSNDRTAAFLLGRLPRIALAERERRRSNSPARRATAFLQAGPTTGWQTPSRFGALGRFYRALLQRLLRPYLVRQREFERAVAAGLEQAELVARHNRDEIARLQQAVAALERDRASGRDASSQAGGS
jgi:glycosyltransferase involved in cell wall biosynthesis